MPHPLIIRHRAIELYEEGMLTQEEVSSTFGIHLSTFKRWISRNRSGEGLAPIKGDKGRPGKIDDIGLQVIEQIVEANPTITLAELSECFHKQQGVEAGRSILSRALKKLNLRRKKISFKASEKNTDEVIKKKKST